MICFLILKPLRRLIPLSIVLLKRTDDIFMAFSKIDNVAQVSKFQVLIRQKYGRRDTISNKALTTSVGNMHSSNNTFEQIFEDNDVQVLLDNKYKQKEINSATDRNSGFKRNDSELKSNDGIPRYISIKLSDNS